MRLSELDAIRRAIIAVIQAYERQILAEVCDSGMTIDLSRLAELRDTIAKQRAVLRDIASATSKLHEADLG
jgi:hypothetical protein